MQYVPQLDQLNILSMIQTHKNTQPFSPGLTQKPSSILSLNRRWIYDIIK